MYKCQDQFELQIIPIVSFNCTNETWYYYQLEFKIKYYNI